MGGVLPVWRIETARLTIRRWSAGDANALAAARSEGLERGVSVEEAVEALERWCRRFDQNDDFVYAAWARDPDALVGGVGAHPRFGPGSFEIGYWLRPSATGQGLATEMAGAMTRVAFEVERVPLVEIRCARSNTASAAIAARLGYVHDATLPRRVPLATGGLEDVLVFAMFAEGYEASAARGFVASAFDGEGRRVL